MTDRDVSSWLPNMLGPLDIQVEGVALDIPRRSTFNFVGFDIEDDPDNERTVITSSGGATAPTGTGFVTVTSGVQDAASAPVGAGVLTFLATPSGANLASALTSALPLTKGGTGLTAVPGSDTQILMNASSAYGAAANVTYVGGFLICATDLKLANSGFELRLSPGTLGSSYTVTLPGAATTLVGRTTTDTLTNKSMSGASNTFTAIPLTTAVTGTLPVGNGGTGVTSLASFATLIDSTSRIGARGMFTDEVVEAGAGPFNNYAIGDYGQISVTAGGGLVTFTGFAAPAAGEARDLIIVAAQAGNGFTVAHEDAGSSAANRIQLNGGLAGGAMYGLHLRYSPAESRWKAVGYPAP